MKRLNAGPQGAASGSPLDRPCDHATRDGTHGRDVGACRNRDRWD
jgi:hypothetical protein